MADDIKIVVKVVGQQDIVKTTKSLKAMEVGVKSLSKDLDAGRISEKQFNTGLKELRRTVDGSFPSWQKAKSAVDAYAKSVLQASNAAKQSKIAQEVAKVSASYDRLKASIDPVFAAQQRMKKAHAEIRAALKAELITRNQAAASLRQYRTALQNGAVAGGMVGKSTNRLGVAMQQTGYQVGDFAVQVQSGTNPMVAFGQQATQLVGVLYLMPQAALAAKVSLLGLRVSVSALVMTLGIAIPVLTAIASAYMLTRRAAKESASGVDTFEDALKSARSEVQGMKDDLILLQSGFENAFVLTLSTAVDNAEKKLKEARDALENLQTADPRGQQEASLAYAAQGERQNIADAEEAVRLAKLELAVAQELARQERERERNASVTNQLHEIRQTLQREGREEAVKQNELEDERQQIITEEIARRERIVGLIQEEAAFQASLYGKTSAEQERANELRAFQNQLVQDGIRPLSTQYLQAVRYYTQMVQNREATENQTKALEDAAKAQELLSAAGLNYETQLLVVNAQIKALQEGKNAEVAAFIEGERVKVTAIYETARALHLQTSNVIGLAEASLAFLDAMSGLDALAAARGKLADIKSTSSGGGKSPQERLADFLDQKRDEAALQSQLVGLFGEERDIKSDLIEFQQQYGDVASKTQTDEYEATIRQIAADKERQRVLEQAVADQQSIADTLQSSMSDAFMSMVDGTKSFKDAMKDMARAVIKQLYEVLVVQRLVGSFNFATGQGSGLAGMIMGAFQADGGAWQGGSQINAYANGGVVGGPTMFPMAGGQTGLMGEAGPEAIMPLKRGANGKLGVQMEGGGQSVVVNQSFNFSANGDDSVKKIIAQAAPQIANMTKKSIMDDRRRGGQMKATFG
jgi:phage-related minor tail protein